MIKLTISQQDLQDIKKSIKTIGKDVKDYRQVWPIISGIVSKAIRRNFMTQRGLSGVWAKLNASTVKAKRRKGYKTRILRASDTLFRAATQITRTQRANQILIQKPTSYSFGVDLIYSYYHDRPRGVRGKRREHMSIPPNYIKDIEDSIINYTIKKVEASWQ